MLNSVQQFQTNIWSLSKWLRKTAQEFQKELSLFIIQAEISKLGDELQIEFVTLANTNTE